MQHAASVIAMWPSSMQHASCVFDTWQSLALQHGTCEGTANIMVYHNGEVIPNTYEGVSFACESTFSFVVPCTITFAELQYGLCQSKESDILKRVSNILYRSPVVVFGDLVQFEVMPIVDETNVQDDRTEAYEGMNNDSDEEFEATYEAGDEDEDDDGGGRVVAETLVVPPAVSQPMDVPPFMRSLDLDAMHVPEFSEYANIGHFPLHVLSPAWRHLEKQQPTRTMRAAERLPRVLDQPALHGQHATCVLVGSSHVESRRLRVEGMLLRVESLLRISIKVFSGRCAESL
ncbi:hypothetical protein AHAS_Ahas20G0241000 [Arachis hypogaea]